MLSSAQRLQNLQRVYVHLKRNHEKQLAERRKRPTREQPRCSGQEDTTITPKGNAQQYGLPPGCTALELLDDDDVRNWFVQLTYSEQQRSSPSARGALGGISLANAHVDNSEGTAEDPVARETTKDLAPAAVSGSPMARVDDEDAVDSIVVSLKLVFLDDLPQQMPLVFIIQPRLVAPFIHLGALCSLELMSQQWELTVENTYMLISSLYETLRPNTGKVTIDASIANFTAAEHEHGFRHIQRAHPHYMRRRRETTGTAGSQPSPLAPSEAAPSHSASISEVAAASQAEAPHGDAAAAAHIPARTKITSGAMLNTFLRNALSDRGPVPPAPRSAVLVPTLPSSGPSTDITAATIIQEWFVRLPELTDVVTDQGGKVYNVEVSTGINNPPLSRTSSVDGGDEELSQEPREQFRTFREDEDFETVPRALAAQRRIAFSRTMLVLRLPTNDKGVYEIEDAASSPDDASADQLKYDLLATAPQHTIPPGCSLTLRDVVLIGSLRVCGKLRLERCLFVGKLIIEGCGELNGTDSIFSIVCEQCMEGIKVLDHGVMDIGNSVVWRTGPHDVLCWENEHEVGGSSFGLPASSPVVDTLLDYYVDRTRPLGFTIIPGGSLRVYTEEDQPDSPTAAGAGPSPDIEEEKHLGSPLPGSLVPRRALDKEARGLRNATSVQVRVKVLIEASNQAILRLRGENLVLQLNVERTIYAEQDATVEIAHSTITAGLHSAVCIQGCRGLFDSVTFQRSAGPAVTFIVSDAERPTGLNAELGGIISARNCIARHLFFGYSTISHSVAHLSSCHAYGVVNGYTVDASTMTLENCSALTTHVAVFTLNQGKCIISDDRGSEFGDRIISELRLTYSSMGKGLRLETSPMELLRELTLEGCHETATPITPEDRSAAAAGSGAHGPEKQAESAESAPNPPDGDIWSEPNGSFARCGFSGGMFTIEVRSGYVSVVGASLWNAEDTSIYVYERGSVDLNDVTIRGNPTSTRPRCGLKVVNSTANVRGCCVYDCAFAFAALQNSAVTLQRCIAIRGVNGFTMDNSTATIKDSAALTKHVAAYCLNKSNVVIDNTNCTMNAAELAAQVAEGKIGLKSPVIHKSKALGVVWMLIPGTLVPCIFRGQVYGVEARTSNVRCIRVLVGLASDSGFNCSGEGNVVLEECAANMTQGNPHGSARRSEPIESCRDASPIASGQTDAGCKCRTATALAATSRSLGGSKCAGAPNTGTEVVSCGSSKKSDGESGRARGSRVKNSGVKAWGGSSCKVVNCEMLYVMFGFGAIGAGTTLDATGCSTRHILNGFTVDGGKAALTDCETHSNHVGVFVVNRGECTIHRGVYIAKMYGIEIRRSTVAIRGKVKVAGFTRIGCFVYDEAVVRADGGDSALQVRVNPNTYRRHNLQSPLVGAALDYDVVAAVGAAESSTGAPETTPHLSCHPSAKAHQQVSPPTSGGGTGKLFAAGVQDVRNMMYGTACIGGSGPINPKAAAKMVHQSYSLPAYMTVKNSSVTIRNGEFTGGVLCGIYCEADSMVTLHDTVVSMCVHGFVVLSGAQLMLACCTAERILQNALVVQKGGSCRVSGREVVKSPTDVTLSHRLPPAGAAAPFRQLLEDRTGVCNGEGQESGSGGALPAAEVRLSPATSTPRRTTFSVLHGSWLVEGNVNAHNVVLLDAKVAYGVKGNTVDVGGDGNMPDERNIWSFTSTSAAASVDAAAPDAQRGADLLWANNRTFIIRVTSLGTLVMNQCFVGVREELQHALKETTTDVVDARRSYGGASGAAAAEVFDALDGSCADLSSDASGPRSAPQSGSPSQRRAKDPKDSTRTEATASLKSSRCSSPLRPASPQILPALATPPPIPISVVMVDGPFTSAMLNRVITFSQFRQQSPGSPAATPKPATRKCALLNLLTKEVAVHLSKRGPVCGEEHAHACPQQTEVPHPRMPTDRECIMSIAGGGAGDFEVMAPADTHHRQQGVASVQPALESDDLLRSGKHMWVDAKLSCRDTETGRDCGATPSVGAGKDGVSLARNFGGAADKLVTSGSSCEEGMVLDTARSSTVGSVPMMGPRTACYNGSAHLGVEVRNGESLTSMPLIGVEITPLLFTVVLINGAKGWIRGVNEEVVTQTLSKYLPEGIAQGSDDVDGLGFSALLSLSGTSPGGDPSPVRLAPPGPWPLTSPDAPEPLVQDLARSAFEAFFPLSVFAARRARLDAAGAHFSTVLVSSGSRARVARSVFTGPTAVIVRRKSKLTVNQCTIISSLGKCPPILCSDLALVYLVHSCVCYPTDVMHALARRSLRSAPVDISNNLQRPPEGAWDPATLADGGSATVQLVCTVRSTVKLEKSSIGTLPVRYQAEARGCSHCKVAPGLLLAGGSTLEYCKESVALGGVSVSDSDQVLQLRGPAFKLWGMSLPSFSLSVSTTGPPVPPFPPFLTTTTSSIATVVAVAAVMVTVFGGWYLR